MQWFFLAEMQGRSPRKYLFSLTKNTYFLDQGIQETLDLIWKTEALPLCRQSLFAEVRLYPLQRIVGQRGYTDVSR